MMPFLTIPLLVLEKSDNSIWTIRVQIAGDKVKLQLNT